MDTVNLEWQIRKLLDNHSRHDIAIYLGVTEDTVNRILKGESEPEYAPIDIPKFASERPTQGASPTAKSRKNLIRCKECGYLSKESPCLACRVRPEKK